MTVLALGLLAATLSGAALAGRIRRRRDPLVDPASRSAIRDARLRKDAAEIEASRLRGRHSPHW